MNEITIADIKCRLDIVDVIGRIYGYSLTKDGDEYKGAILATSKSGKSLNVNPDKQVYNDFSGHAGGGDVLDLSNC
jgi:DNA primase